MLRMYSGILALFTCLFKKIGRYIHVLGTESRRLITPNVTLWSGLAYIFGGMCGPRFKTGGLGNVALPKRRIMAQYMTKVIEGRIYLYWPLM